jgi:hypothetical protein
MSEQVRQQMTLFDPLTQIASADVLLSHGSVDRRTAKLFEKLIDQVFEDEFRVSFDSNRLHFKVEDEPVEAIELPDGFRSSIAWMANLCHSWCQKSIKGKGRLDPSDIEAIILLDEIDLHLHPSLQRSLIPKLRRALPRVQWVVSTHAPLVISSFDRREIIALDRNEPEGIRILDRQIFGFSTDEIYNWLMETPATSAALEDKLDGDDLSPQNIVDELDVIAEMSPTVNELEAKKRANDLRQSLKNLGKKKI